MDFKEKELERLRKEFKEAKENGDNLVLINIDGAIKVIRPKTLTEEDFINQYSNSGYFTNEGVTEVRDMIGKKDAVGLLNAGVAKEDNGTIKVGNNIIDVPKGIVIGEQNGVYKEVSTTDIAKGNIGNVIIGQDKVVEITGINHKD